MPVRLLHRRKHFTDEGIGNPLVEKVAHGVHEDHSRSLPFLRLIKSLRPDTQIEPLLVRMTRNASPSLRESLCIAGGAARRDLVATGNRVPSRLSPLDTRFICHALSYPMALSLCERMFPLSSDSLSTMAVYSASTHIGLPFPPLGGVA